MSTYLKREIPLTIAFVVGMIMLTDYFFRVPEISTIASKILNWTLIIGGTMIGLGVINIFMIHIRRARRRIPGQWLFSIWLMFGIVFMFFLGVNEGLLTGRTLTDSPLYTWFYINVNMATSVTIFSLFGFYVVSAAIHAFQVRNIESLLLATGAIIVFLWNAPVGGAIWQGFGPLGTWVSDTIVGSTFRAVTICMAVGVLSLGLRTLLGRERGYLGAE